MAIKKVPQRRCIGCNISKDKNELIRIVKNNQNEISVDLTGKKAGRGAYICKNGDCLQKAQKANRLQRAFECNISEEIFVRLNQEIEHE